MPDPSLMTRLPSAVDLLALRQAIDLFADADGFAPIQRVAGAYKVLTPGRPMHQLTLEALRATGAVLVEEAAREEGLPAGSAVRLRMAAPSAVRFALSEDDLLHVAYRFGLHTSGADPVAGWADLSAMIMAIRSLADAVGLSEAMGTGKGIRRTLEASGRWDLHVLYNHALVRPRPEHRWRRTITWFPPGDAQGRRDPRGPKSLAQALHHVHTTATHAIADATRVTITRACDGARDVEVFYDRAADAWRLADGAPAPKAYWFSSAEEYLLETELDERQRAELAEHQAWLARERRREREWQVPSTLVLSGASQG